MTNELLANLTPEDREWILADERRWQEARSIAERFGVDFQGVYRVLRNLEKSPAERLKSALRHGRLFSVHAR